ncbi:MAG: hypothetical protein GX775_02385 [Erysipelothrix sp.]|nr:hypothetical protein [Erysipelothrix sp.]
MKLHLKQKVFSFVGRFSIKDDQGSEKYYAESQILSWGRKYRVYNQYHEEVIFIQEKIFSFLPKYFIRINGVDVARIEKQFTFFKPKYELIAHGWEIDGDWTGHDYDIKHQGNLIASIRKEWFTWGDSYYVDINDDQHELMCLAIVIAIDCVLDAQQANNNAGANG